MPDRLRVGILATHPIQYHAPLYRAIASRGDVDLTVFFAHRPTPEEQGAGFGVPFEWDVDLLEGYRSVFLKNRRSPSSAGEFRGYDTPEIQHRLRTERFDAFVVSGWHALTYWQAFLACRRMRVPILVRGDSQLVGEGVSRRALKRTLYPWFMHRFAVCLSVGRRSEEYFRYYGARQVVRAPHFVDNEYFAASVRRARAKRAALRGGWGIPESAFVCLFAGKLVAKKRPLDAIRGAALARDRRVHVLIAGDGELRGECEREARRLNVATHFAGFLNQSRIAEAYAAADVLVLPSDERETWGLVVNEAMAGGLPVIVSAAAGCYPDLVIEGQTGYGVPLGDTERLGMIMARLAQSCEQRSSLAREAESHVARFSAQAAGDGVVRGVRLARERST